MSSKLHGGIVTNGVHQSFNNYNNLVHGRVSSDTNRQPPKAKAKAKRKTAKASKRRNRR